MCTAAWSDEITSLYVKLFIPLSHVSCIVWRVSTTTAAAAAAVDDGGGFSSVSHCVLLIVVIVVADAVFHTLHC